MLAFIMIIACTGCTKKVSLKILDTDYATEDFINTDEELALFQIAGHSYDLDTENLWDKIENIFKKISLQKDILPMTTIEIIDYLKAMEQVEITERHIINNSEQTLWFLVDDVVREVEAKRELQLLKHRT